MADGLAPAEDSQEVTANVESLRLGMASGAPKGGAGLVKG